MNKVLVLNKENLERVYADLNSLKAVGRYFKKDPGTIKRYMIKYGLYFKPQVRYNCDNDFFSRDNEESFYIAGFIAADGCVKIRNNTYEVFIGLSKKDKYFLEKLRNIIKAESPIRDYLVKNSKRNINYNNTWSSQLLITSKKMYNDLARFNIVPRKSLIYTFPEWLKNHPLKHHFIRGYNDGDGSFYSPKLGKGRKIKQIYFSMRGTSEFLTSVRSILEEECSISKRDKPIRISSNHGCLEYGGNNIVNKIFNYLYKDAAIYLPRKYEIATKSKLL